MSTLFAPTDRGATLSGDGLYRYDLWRAWGDAPQRLGFIMLNPSTADALEDDATLRRCMGFAKREGFHGLTVRNLFAYRTSKPKVLIEALRDGVDVVGPENDRWLTEMVEPAEWPVPKIVMAWGSPAKRLRARIEAVLELLTPAGEAGRCLVFAHGAGATPHPLYLSAETPLVRT